MTDRQNISGDCNCMSRVNHIKCEVSNCRYHGEQDCCHAEMIQVTPGHASTKSETSCSTFQAQ